MLDIILCLIAGNSQKWKKKKNPKCIRQVQSYSKIIVYAVHNGKIKMSRHIMLGMSLKILTSSCKIIDIIHSYVHFINYAGVEELHDIHFSSEIKRMS